MPSTSSNYKSVHDYRFHGDEVFDPRSDLSQGRGDDAEHPSFIPMYTTWTQGDPVPRCFPFLFSRDMDATLSADLVHAQEQTRRPWRAQGPRPSAHGREGRRASTYRPRTSGPQARTSGAPDIRALAGNPAPLSRRHPWLNPSSPDIRPLGPDIRHLGKARTSGPRPDIRPLSAHSVSGLRPMYPSPTYPFVDLDYIYPSTSS